MVLTRYGGWRPLLRTLAQIEPANQANTRPRGFDLVPAQVCVCVVSGVPMREDGRGDEERVMRAFGAS